MANFADAAPIDAIARRLACRIPRPRPRMRATRLFYDALASDERCARPLSKNEIALAPDWAPRAVELGVAVCAFDPNPDALAALRRVARAVKQCCAEFDDLSAMPRATLTTRDLVLRQLIGEFLDKIERMPLDVVAEKARTFARERTQRLKENKAREPLFGVETLFPGPGRSWARIVSVSELAAVGREFGNCLAKATRHHLAYARKLKLDHARFWVLRDQRGAGLMVAMTDSFMGKALEVRGMRNASVAAGQPDLECLLRFCAKRALLADLAPAGGAATETKDDRH